MPSKSKKQERLMVACADGAKYAKCPSQSIAKEFNQADATKPRVRYNKPKGKSK